MQMTPYPWQDSLWQRLIRQYQQHQLPHALLLGGSQYLGKQAFARAFAARVLCQKMDGSLSALACGVCSSCLWFFNGTHPDFLEICPEAAGKSIKIDSIRALLEKVSHTPQSGRYQVVLIVPAESMNIAASNALLKTLEQPCGHVLFLLVSHQPGTLPATIRSRCQPLRFTTPMESEALSWLQLQSPKADWPLWLKLAEGMPLRALSLAQPEEAKTYREDIHRLFALADGKLSPIAEAAACQKKEFEVLYAALWALSMDVLRVRLGCADQVIHTQYLSELQTLSKKLSIFAGFHFIDVLLDLRKKMAAKINLNACLLYETVFFSWSALFAQEGFVG